MAAGATTSLLVGGGSRRRWGLGQIATVPDEMTRLVGVVAPRHHAAVVLHKLEATGEHWHHSANLLAIFVRGDHLAQLESLLALQTVVSREGMLRSGVRVLVGEAEDLCSTVPLTDCAQLLGGGIAVRRLWPLNLLRLVNLLLLLLLLLDLLGLLIGLLRLFIGLLRLLISLLLELPLTGELSGAPRVGGLAHRHRHQTSQHYQLHRDRLRGPRSEGADKTVSQLGLMSVLLHRQLFILLPLTGPGFLAAEKITEIPEQLFLFTCLSLMHSILLIINYINRHMVCALSLALSR